MSSTTISRASRYSSHSPLSSSSPSQTSSPDSSRSLKLSSTPPTTSSRPSNRSIHAPPSTETPPSSPEQSIKIQTSTRLESNERRAASNSSLLSALCGEPKSPTSPRSNRDPITGRRLPSWYSIHAPEGFRPTPPTNPYKLSNRLLSNAMDGLKAQSEKSTSLSPSCDPTPLPGSSTLTRRASTGSDLGHGGQRREDLEGGRIQDSPTLLNSEMSFDDPSLQNTFRSDAVATTGGGGGQVETRSNTLGLNLGPVPFPSPASPPTASTNQMQLDEVAGLPEAVQDILELESEVESLKVKLANQAELFFKVKEHELASQLETSRTHEKKIKEEKTGLSEKIKELEEKVKSLESAKIQKKTSFESTMEKVGQEQKVAQLERQVIELTKRLEVRPENVRSKFAKGNYSRNEMLEMQGSKLAKLSERNVERDEILPREISASEACKEMRIQLDHYERNEQSSTSRGRGAGRNNNNNNSPNSISNPRPLSTLNPNFGMGPSFVELENLKRANLKLQEELKESHQTVEELLKELSTDSGFHEPPPSPESSRQSSIHVIEEEEEEEEL